MQQSLQVVQQNDQAKLKAQMAKRAPIKSGSLEPQNIGFRSETFLCIVSIN
jgi:hypothetical protein